MENNVKVLKLITGEEILARIEQKKTTIVLEEPLLLLNNLNQQTGQFVLSLIPWIMSGKNKKITISIDHVVAEDDSKEQAEKNYLASVTGLTLPNLTKQ